MTSIEQRAALQRQIWQKTFVTRIDQLRSEIDSIVGTIEGDA